MYCTIEPSPPPEQILLQGNPPSWVKILEGYSPPPLPSQVLVRRGVGHVHVYRSNDAPPLRVLVFVARGNEHMFLGPGFFLSYFRLMIVTPVFLSSDAICICFARRDETRV